MSNPNSIKHIVQTSSNPFIVELRNSIKLIDIEERYDLVFSRPLGLLLAKLAQKLGLTPLHVSLLSLGIGMLSGYFFAWSGNTMSVLIGGFLLTLAGILDSSDGQLARRTQVSSRFGMMVDGLVDTFVFGSVYVGGAWFMMMNNGFPAILLVVISGLCHSTQTMIFDYYKNEFSFYIGGFEKYRNPSFEEIKAEYHQSTHSLWEKIVYFGYKDYAIRQLFFTFRGEKIKSQFEKLSQSQPDFKDRYRSYFSPILSGWALFGGSNTHRNLMIIFCLIGRFDWYLWVNIGLLIPIALLTVYGLFLDKKFLKSFH